MGEGVLDVREDSNLACRGYRIEMDKTPSFNHAVVSCQSLLKQIYPMGVRLDLYLHENWCLCLEIRSKIMDLVADSCQ